MAFSPSPSTWITGWSTTNGNADITIAGFNSGAFPEMTSAEANATTGDIRKVLYAMCEGFYQQWNNTATGDRPLKYTITRTSTVNEINNQITKRYTFTFVTAPSGADVVSE